MNGMRALSLMVALGGPACQRQVHGAASLYLYNATPNAARVYLEGSTDYLVDVRAGSGELIDNVVAGSYEVGIEQGNTRQNFPLALAQDRLGIVNVGAVACFARADVAGMYSKGKAPVRLQQVYRGVPVVAIPEVIEVRPGESLPEKRPKSPFGFLRVMVVPCELRDDWLIEDYMMTHR